MKNINVVFEDSDFKRLQKTKGALSWNDFILTLVNKDLEDE